MAISRERSDRADIASVDMQAKIGDLDSTIERVRSAQSAGEAVVVCHGCFDIVHPGHIRHLQQAAALGDRLLVTVSADEGVNKGVGRPLIPQTLRAENLAALDCVTWVMVNPLSTAAEMLERIKPDIYVKGREYEHNADPRFALERKTIERNGGRVVFSSGDVVFSSTALIDAMRTDADPAAQGARNVLDGHGFGSQETAGLLDAMANQRVLVVGEAIIDTYVLCDRPSVAGESPMMTLRPRERRRYDGGAAIIARHLAAMGAKPVLVTALPRRPEAEAMRERLAAEGVDVRDVPCSGPVLEKQRFLVGTTKVVKLDLGEALTLDTSEQDSLRATALEAATGADAVILADYGEGLFSGAVTESMCDALRDRVRLLVGDVSGRRSNLLAMQDMDVLCPSEWELREALHDFDEGLTSVVWRLLEKTRARAAVVTQGEDGLTAFERRTTETDPDEVWVSRLSAEHVPAHSVYAMDALGCGDALIAALTLAMSSGAPLGVAGVLGNIAAGIQAQRLGNIVIDSAMLREGMARLAGRAVNEPQSMVVAAAQ